MQNSRKTKLQELQTVISRMPIDVCFKTVQPDFGVRWKDVASAIRNARLPMTPASIARVLCKSVARNLPPEEIDDILSRLRLKLIAVQRRMWHVITLKEPVYDEPIEPVDLQESLLVSLAGANKGKKIFSEVHTVQLGDLIFVSVQLTSETRSSAPLYLAVPPGLPVALTSSIHAVKLLKVCVQGLGYNAYEDACLHGHDIPSLFRVHAGADENFDRMTTAPDYCPVPVVTKTGIDYTNRAYDESYVDAVLGPKPPLISNLRVNTTRPFFDTDIMDKPMKLMMQMKSDDVAKTLKTLVVKGALAPTSEFFTVFNKLKSNQINNFDDE